MRRGYRRFLDRMKQKPGWQEKIEKTIQPKKSNWRKGQRKPERFKFIPPDKVALLIDSANEAGDLRASVAIRLSFYLGLRISEVADLRLSDINLDEKKVYVRTLKRGKRMKTKSEKRTKYWARDEAHRPTFPIRIPASKEALATIEEAMDLAMADRSGAGFVFQGLRHGTPITRRWICTRFCRYRKMSGIDHRYTFHSLRHTNATLIAMGTKDPLVVRDQLRHANVAQSDRYMRAAWDYSEEIGASVSLTATMSSPTPKVSGKKM